MATASRTENYQKSRLEGVSGLDRVGERIVDEPRLQKGAAVANWPLSAKVYGPLPTTVEDLRFSGGGHILVRPTTITSEPNTKHPVAIWGPGGGTPPRDYLQLLTRMALQGFVIVGIRESTGDAVLMSAAIDWLEDQDADSSSPMHDRLILDAP